MNVLVRHNLRNGAYGHRCPRIRREKNCGEARWKRKVERTREERIANWGEEDVRAQRSPAWSSVSPRSPHLTGGK